MRRALANWLNYQGRTSDQSGNVPAALRWYRLATRLDPNWSVPWYNLGLIAKYSGDWQESLRLNAQSAGLAGDDEASWWNLGIAATAVRDWRTARKAWGQVGIDVPPGDEEWQWEPTAACVRLNPDGNGEVVWGERIDPARIVLTNVPLPESKHRFRDIVLHDGAANGHRVLNETEVPVFDELEVWAPSSFVTFVTVLLLPNHESEHRLIEICLEMGLGIEDWSTIRWICATCSRGNPGPHDCTAGPLANEDRRYAIAAHTFEEANEALTRWVAAGTGVVVRSLESAG